MFFHRYPESYTPFSSPHFSRSNDARISLIKLLTLSTDSVTKYLVAKIKPEINCTDDSYFLCDRVCTQSNKPKENILVVFDWEKCGLENSVYLSGYR